MTGYPTDGDVIGGHVALDLVNTVAWRLDPARRADRLVDLPTLLRWAVRTGVVDATTADRLARAGRADPDAADAALHGVRELRETLHGTLSAAAAGTAPTPDTVTALRDALVVALTRATLRADLPLRWDITASVPADLGTLLTLAGMDLLQDAQRIRAVRSCQGAGCGWLFIDQSRSHTRRWCSAGDCGNRDRVRRHYARTRTAR